MIADGVGVCCVLSGVAVMCCWLLVEVVVAVVVQIGLLLMSLFVVAVRWQMCVARCVFLFADAVRRLLSIGVAGCVSCVVGGCCCSICVLLRSATV